MDDRIPAAHHAMAELRRLRCTDPAARRALAAIRLTAHTLEFFWLPAVAERTTAERPLQDRGRGQAGDLGSPGEPGQPQRWRGRGGRLG